MANLDQRRAHRAFEDVKGVPRADRAKYDTYVHALPAMLRNAGLSQALHFLHGRKDKQGSHRLLDHLRGALTAIASGGNTATTQGFLEFVRKADTVVYMAMTREAIAASDWYRRAVQSLDPDTAKDTP